MLRCGDDDDGDDDDEDNDDDDDDWTSISSFTSTSSFIPWFLNASERFTLQRMQLFSKRLSSFAFMPVDDASFAAFKASIIQGGKLSLWQHAHEKVAVL